MSCVYSCVLWCASVISCVVHYYAKIHVIPLMMPADIDSDGVSNYPTSLFPCQQMKHSRRPRKNTPHESYSPTCENNDYPKKYTGWRWQLKCQWLPRSSAWQYGGTRLLQMQETQMKLIWQGMRNVRGLRPGTGSQYLSATGLGHVDKQLTKRSVISRQRSLEESGWGLTRTIKNPCTLWKRKNGCITTWVSPQPAFSNDLSLETNDLCLERHVRFAQQTATTSLTNVYH